MTDRISGWVFWTTITLLLLLAYPLSIGPAYLLATRIKRRPGPDLKWPLTVVGIAYAPVTRLAGATNSIGAVGEYINWWFPTPIRRAQQKEASALP